MNPLWTELPYPGEQRPPKNPEEPLSGNWPLYYLIHSQTGGFKDSFGNVTNLRFKDPAKIDFNKELLIVRKTLKKLTNRQKLIATYWGTGVASKQWAPIIDRLIDSYGSTAPGAARILAAAYAGINDAFTVAWFIKYRYLVARPTQLDRTLPTVLRTPRHPSYPSGHAAVAGAASTILKYFFPSEAARLDDLAEECALSRLYGGIHFLVDNNEGLKLGRQIGNIAVRTLKNAVYLDSRPIDNPPLLFKNAQLPPPPYRQAIPFNFADKFILPSFHPRQDKVK